MKEKFRKLRNNSLFTFILGGLMFGSLGVYAVNYLAADVTYTKEGIKVNDVKEALDDIYNKINIGNATAEDISNGKTALVQGKLVTGTANNSSEYKKIVLLGTYTNNNGGSYAGISSTSPTIDVSIYDNYESFTESNFIVEAISGAGTAWVNDGDHDISLPYTISKSYNANTGILTVSNTSASWDGSWRKTSAGLTKYNVYLIY